MFFSHHQTQVQGNKNGKKKKKKKKKKLVGKFKTVSLIDGVTSRSPDSDVEDDYDSDNSDIEMEAAVAKYIESPTLEGLAAMATNNSFVAIKPDSHSLFDYFLIASHFGWRGNSTAARTL